MALFGKRGLAILAPSAHKILSEKLLTQSDPIQLDIELFNRECCEPEIERLCSRGRECRSEFVVRGMVGSINKHFAGVKNPEIGCMACHQGRLKPTR